MGVPRHVRDDLFAWFDAALSQAIPRSTAAFHVNLYEGTDSVHVQLMGADSFSTNPEYWPGAETFSTGEDIFEVSFAVAGAEWKDWLQCLRELVTDYVQTGNRSAVLRSSLSVGIGFVDGDMYVLWQRQAV